MRLDFEQAQAINEVAYELGIQPQDLATAIAYETIGTMDPGIKGGANRDGTGRGTYKGLIQFSPRNQQYFGVKPGMSFKEQLKGPVKDYLQHTGVKPGMGLKDVYSAILAGAPGRYGRRDINGTVLDHVARMESTYGKSVAEALAQAATPSQGLLDFAQQEQQLDPLAVDTSFAGLFSMDSIPGIDGLHSSQMSRDSIPEGKPYDALSEFVSFNEARDGNQATGIGAAFQDALGPSMADFAVVDPFSEIFSGMEAAPAMAAVPADRFDQAFSAFSGPTAAMPADVSISTITPDRAPQSAMTSGVPQGRFDQTFDVFGAPSVAATTAGLPSLDPAQTLESRPEVVGPSMNLDGITATPSAKPGKDEGKGKGGFGKFNPEDPNELGALGKAAFAAGLMSNPAMAIGGLALSNAINGRALNAGMGFGLGNAFGGLGGLGGLFDGSPSVGHAALGFAANNAMNNPNYGTWDFARDFTNMGGMISNGRAAPGMVTAAEFNAAQRDAGLAMGIMEGFSRDFGSAFGGLGGLGGNGSAGGNAGGKSSGKGGSSGRGGGNKGDAGVGGADGGK